MHWLGTSLFPEVHDIFLTRRKRFVFEGKQSPYAFCYIIFKAELGGLRRQRFYLMRHYYLKAICLLLLLLGTVATAGAYDFVSNGIYYNITNSTNKTVEVTYKDTNYNSYSGSVSIPSTVTNSGTTYSVTSIGSYAFQDCSGMTNVHIASTITSIGYAAFRRCVAV